MTTLNEILQWIQNVTFLLVGAWAFVRWRRRGTEQSRWLAATFVTLGGVVLLGLLVGEGEQSLLQDVLSRVSLVLLTVFPYLLLRFLDSFESIPTWSRRVTEAATVLVAVTGIALPDLPEAGESGGALFGAFLVGLVLLWGLVLPTVAVRFWRAGGGQPTLVRRRLRTLSLATISISAALLLLAANQDPAPGFTLVVQVVGLASAGLFLIGFAPPRQLRTVWRQPEEARLHEASVQLMGATDPAEVAALLVPHVRDVLSARAIALVHRDAPVVSVGLGLAEEEAVARGTLQAPTTYDLTAGAIHVWPNSYTPFFGEEEMDLLSRLAVLTDLALARTGLLSSERRARAELEAANAELESFVYSASHDLKSPLITIQSYLDVLSEEAADQLDEDAAFYMERMRSNARYMEALVGDLLELSRVGRVDTSPEPVELAALVDEIVTELAGQHPHVEASVGRLPIVEMNPLRCRQLFRNLLENAVAHGGARCVWVEARPSEDGAWTVLVRDDGEGIPEQYRERVFGVFERLGSGDAREGGTGIGLAVCRKIVETVGGRIWVTDHDGGAEFAILFPPTVVATGDTTTEEVLA